MNHLQENRIIPCLPDVIIRTFQSGDEVAFHDLNESWILESFSMDDNLAAPLTQGPPRLLAYKLSVLNRAGKSDEESPPVYVAAGHAPATVTGFTAMPRRNGIVLSWQRVDPPAGVTAWVRFNRVRTSAPPAQPQIAQSSMAHDHLTGAKPEAEPAEQILRVSESAGGRPSSAIDTTAHTGNTYRYIAQRVYQVTQVALDGRVIEIASQPSVPAETAYRDVFPPPVPIGLVSAADSSSRSIDLDWTPDVDPGLAGYIVYRRAAGVSETPQRISPAGKPENFDHPLYFIRDGIVIIPKNGVIPHGTVI